MKTWLKRSVVMVAVLAAIVGVGGTAFAGQGTYGDDGVRIRSYPINGTIYGLGYPGQQSYVYWGVDCTNGVVNGNPWWDWNKDITTGVTGYSSDYYLTAYADTYYYTGTPC